MVPKPCGSLPCQGSEKVEMCAFLTANLPVDHVEIKNALIEWAKNRLLSYFV